MTSGYAVPPVASTPAVPEQAATETPVEAPPPASASEGSHPLVVSNEEGLFTVSQEQMVSLLQKVLKLKYTAVLMYMNYGDRIRAHFRDALYAHFQEHLNEERQACYDLAMKITALGGEPDVQVTKVPSTPVIMEMMGHIMQAEKVLIESQRNVIAACGENIGLRVLMENSLLLDQRHLDDARRMSILTL